MKPEEAKKYILDKFKGFSNYIEVDDFKSFLILALHQIAEQKQFFQQIMGQSGNPTLWFYEEHANVFFMEFGLKKLGFAPIIVYNRSNKNVDFIIKGDNKLFSETLNKQEMEILVKPKMIAYSPTIFDHGRNIITEDEMSIKTIIKVNSVYKRLEEFIVSPAILSYFFLLESETGPDIIFTLRKPIKVNNKSLVLQPLDVYLDEEKKLRGNLYVMLDENLKMTLIKEFKMEKADLFEKNVTLIVRVKSFDKYD